MLKSVFALLLTASAALASNVVDLTPSNFDEIVGSGKPALVEFYAPWCGHCKTLAPVYEELADSFKAQDKVIIAKVNADDHRSLGSRYGVKGFPTLKIFDGTTKNPKDYNKARDLDSLQSFITETTGIKPKGKKVEPSDVVVLTDANFDSIVLDPSNDVLVEFYAPWCGYCKQLAPVWEIVARDFSSDEHVVVAKLDATEHPAAAERYGVKGYPTLKFFPKGADKTPVDYPSGRTEADFVAYLNEQTGAQRVVGGGLTDEAGRVPALDALAQEFVAAEDKESVIAKAKSVVAGDANGSYYVKAMEKIVANPKHVANEIHRLESIIAKGNLAKAKLDSFIKRKNILSAFEFTAAKDEL
ncbi:hypothetical protein YB2330_000489 [Saitoella coloradoensis]